MPDVNDSNRKIFRDAAQKVITPEAAEDIVQAMKDKACVKGDVRAAKFLLHIIDGRPESWVNHRVEVNDEQLNRLKDIFGLHEPEIGEIETPSVEAAEIKMLESNQDGSPEHPHSEEAPEADHPS